MLFSQVFSKNLKIPGRICTIFISQKCLHLEPLYLFQKVDIAKLIQQAKEQRTLLIQTKVRQTLSFQYKVFLHIWLKSVYEMQQCVNCCTNCMDLFNKRYPHPSHFSYIFMASFTHLGLKLLCCFLSWIAKINSPP